MLHARGTSASPSRKSLTHAATIPPRAATRTTPGWYPARHREPPRRSWESTASNDRSSNGDPPPSQRARRRREHAASTQPRTPRMDRPRRRSRLRAHLPAPARALRVSSRRRAPACGAQHQRTARTRQLARRRRPVWRSYGHARSSMLTLRDSRAAHARTGLVARIVDPFAPNLPLAAGAFEQGVCVGVAELALLDLGWPLGISRSMASLPRGTDRGAEARSCRGSGAARATNYRLPAQADWCQVARQHPADRRSRGGGCVGLRGRASDTAPRAGRAPPGCPGWLPWSSFRTRMSVHRQA